MIKNLTGKPMCTELLPAGNYWTGRLRRGRSLRMTALGPAANVSALFFNAE